jgi:Ca2+-binding EF-hand superfamily protein
VLSSIFKRF